MATRGENQDTNGKEKNEDHGKEEETKEDGRFSEVRRQVAIHMEPHRAAGHGPDHCEAVLAHVDAALAVCEPRLSDLQSLVLRLAALLHDVDDPKLTASSTDYKNAREILAHGYDDSITEQVTSIISIVSCSANGNTVTALPSDSWKLIVRAADRLEALGQIGVDRCLAFAAHKKLPMSTPNTPLAKTEEDIDRFATPERFTAYSTGQISSVSVIDHFYDKLLHIGDMTGITTNRYLLEEAARRTAFMRAFVLRACLNVVSPSPSPFPSPSTH